MKSYRACQKDWLNIRQMVSEECTEEEDLNGEDYS